MVGCLSSLAVCKANGGLREMPHNFQLPVEPHIAEQRSNRTSLSQARHDSSDRRPVSHGRAAPSALHDARSRPEVGLPSFVLAI